MQSKIIQLGRTAESPTLNLPGITLVVPNNPHSKIGNKPLMAYGCCRIPRTPSLEKTSLLSGLTLTAVELTNQIPVSINPIGTKLVFEDDILNIGYDWAIWFRCDLQAWLNVAGRPYSFMLHASLYQYLSNVIYVRMEL